MDLYCVYEKMNIKFLILNLRAEHCYQIQIMKIKLVDNCHGYTMGNHFKV